MNYSSMDHDQSVPLVADGTVLSETDYRRYVESLLAGDRAMCRDLVQGVLDKKGPIRHLYEGVFRPTLYAVGEMWERGQISVADEHLATAMTESLMTLVEPLLFESQRVGRSVVVSCIANEYHQIGGKMVADTFEINGWDSYFLGANTPQSELIRLIEKKRPNVIALSASVYSRMHTLIDDISILRDHFPTTEIWVGGQAFRWGGRNLLTPIPLVRLHANLAELELDLNQRNALDG